MHLGRCTTPGKTRLSYHEVYLRAWEFYIPAHRLRGADRGLLGAGAGWAPPTLTATELAATAVAATLSSSADAHVHVR